jgi:hypothetical protein
MNLRAELEPFASNGREAARIVEDFIDSVGVVVALRRDRRFTNIPLSEFELLLADVRVDAERCLFNELRGTVHLDHVDYVAGDEL